MLKSLIVFLFLIFPLVSVHAFDFIRSYEVSAEPVRMNQIADRFEVVKKLSHGHEVYVKEEDVKTFLKLAPNAKLISKDIYANFRKNDKAIQQNLANYRKFSDVERDLNTIVSTYKNLTSLETYGETRKGRKLYALKISSSNKNFRTVKPEIMVTAATHGDELITVEVLFSLINEMLQGYGKKLRITKMIDGRDIYFIPVVSPDGFEARDRYVQGYDPNRNFPWPQNEHNESIDCIKGIMDFSNHHNFVASLDLHAYGKLVMFPWAYTKMPPLSKDEVMFKDLVQSMAKSNQYTAGQISTTIYIAKGSSADYFYWKKNTHAIAVELADEKIPPYETIPKITNEAREMMWTFLEYFN